MVRRPLLPALAMIDNKIVEQPAEENLKQSENISQKNTPIMEVISDKLENLPTGTQWKDLNIQLAEPEEPIQEEKIVKPKSQVVHGFRVYKSEGRILLQLGLEPKDVLTQKLLMAFVMYLRRELSVEVKVGSIDGWTCPCAEASMKAEPIEPIALLLAYEKYTVNKPYLPYFKTEFFKLVFAKMRGKLTHEVAVPEGTSYILWLLRDILRFFWRFVPLEALQRIIQRIAPKFKTYMKVRLHDVSKLKSVCSIAEWRFLTTSALDGLADQVKVLKDSVVKFKQFEYEKFVTTCSEMCVKVIGKPALHVLYDRIRMRNALKLVRIKDKKNPAVPLQEVLDNLMKNGSYSGVHLLPAVLKFRSGELSILKSMTLIDKGKLVGTDSRFGTMEDYLHWAMDNPTSKEDSFRVVDTDLKEEDFPPLE